MPTLAPLSLRRALLLGASLLGACTSAVSPTPRGEPAVPEVVATATRLAGPEVGWAEALRAAPQAFREVPGGWHSVPARGATLPVDARFPRQGDEAVVLRASPGDPRPTVVLRPRQAQSSPQRDLEGRIVAREVWPATDVLWTAHGTRAEAFLLLRDARAPTTFAWDLELGPEVVRTEAQADGSILALDGEGLPRLILPAATARDDAGTARRAEMTLADGRLTVRLDTRGLRFPVLLDPAFEVAQWRAPQANVRPPGTSDAAMTWIATRGIAALWTGSGPSGAQLWEWDGARWTRPFLDLPFPPARATSLAYDSARDEVVLFGGGTVSNRFGDQWRYDGSGWREVIAEGPGPEARAGMAVAYDPQRRVLVVTGGAWLDRSLTPPLDVRSDHWEYSLATNTWTRRLPHAAATSFGPRWRHRMVWDTRRAVMVLLGGSDLPGGAWARDVWEYNPGENRWVERVAQGESPDFEGEFAAAYDPFRARVVCFGGGRAAVWSWDGTQWSTQDATGGPGAVRGNTGAFDLLRRRFLSYGDAEGSNTLHEFASRGTACASAADCHTGACTDGVCCTTSSCGTCARCDGGTFATSGVCSPVRGGDDDTCNGRRTCDGTAQCAARPCNAASECGPGGACVDGVCCDRACDGACEACTAAKKGGGVDGTCGPVALDTDPDDECRAATELAAVCAPGVCNGAGRCRVNVGAPCAPAICVDPVTARRPAVCAPDGSCATVLVPCAPYRCGDGACLTTCDNDSECAPGSGCNRGRCEALTPVGGRCDAPNRCVTGHCVDGVCCDRACDGTCEACTAMRRGGGEAPDGVCAPIAAGADPGDECADPTGDDVACATGACDGAGACGVRDRVACGTASCLDATTARGVGACRGGQCVAGPVTACGPGSCAGGVCRADCRRGARCTAGNSCDSGFCVDGVCCDRACNGTCEACTAAQKGGGLDGTCGAIAAGSDPDDECTDGRGDDATCRPGVCDGFGACLVRPSAPCGRASCDDETTRRAQGWCSPEGRCQAGPTTACAPFACREGACLRRCALDAECGPGVRCLEGVCAAPREEGSACTTGRQCASGHCVDGVCCDRACNGACEACSAARKGLGSDGTCGFIGAGRDPDDECQQGSAAICAPGVCDGRGACLEAPGGVCAPARCLDETTALAVSTCGARGRCETPAAVPCGTLRCREGACLTHCANAGDCRSGWSCEEGGCVPPPPDAGPVDVVLEPDVPAADVVDVSMVVEVVEVVEDAGAPPEDVSAPPPEVSPPPSYTGGPACTCQVPGARPHAAALSLLVIIVAARRRRREVRG